MTGLSEGTTGPTLDCPILREGVLRLLEVLLSYLGKLTRLLIRKIRKKSTCCEKLSSELGMSQWIPWTRFAFLCLPLAVLVLA